MNNPIVKPHSDSLYYGILQPLPVPFVSEFQVRRKNLTEHRQIESVPAEIGAGEILLEIDRFAFTANNITYGVAGDRLGYWQFFPPTADYAGDWGLLPVWGFADVVDSQCDDIHGGDRFYGYFPPANMLTMKPARVTASGITDGAEHRAALPPAYNHYRRLANTEGNPAKGTTTRNDEMQALLNPLYITSYCLWDFLVDNKWFDAAQIIILSASSKTSIGLGYALAADRNAPPVVAFTASHNVQTVENLNLYNQVSSYNTPEAPKNVASVIVDMSGNSNVMGSLHRYLGDNMRRTLNVGITHWSEPRTMDGIIAERSNLFFAPGHIQKRYKDWGADEFQQRTGQFMQDTIAKSERWLQMERLDGLNGLASVYSDICNGKIPPNKGLIVEMQGSGA